MSAKRIQAGDPDRRVRQAKPLLKWVGGKTQLLPVILKEIDRLHPGPIDQYYEPFLGGAAVFFALARLRRLKSAILSDSNEELINFYEAVQSSPASLIRALARLKKKGFGESRYYEVRDVVPRSEIGRAARFLYINKCGYNGLWRVNQKAICNVPYGHHKIPPTILDEEAIWSAHYALACAELRWAPFWSVDIFNLPATFVYFDPPYWPTRPTANFTSYTAFGFTKGHQQELARWMREIARHRIPVLLSNSDVPETRELYHGLKIKTVQARRNVNSVGSGRGAVSEILVSSETKRGE